jgi:cytoskeletal protein CcmA (bactofilin family)
MSCSLQYSFRRNRLKSMNDDKTRGSEKSMLGKASALFHRGRDEGSEERLSLNSYWVGDIREERLVQIETGAAVAGNVVAPRVIISGLVYGSVTAREIRVEGSGQIWGDVYVAALELAPGGKLHGWVTTLDGGTVDLLRSGEISLGDLPGPTSPDLVTNERNGSLAAEMLDPETSGHWLRIWRQLQAEAAVALIARAEIEATFEERLREAIEESSGRSETQATSTSTGEPAETLDQRMGGLAGESRERPVKDELEEDLTNPDAQLWQKVAAMTEARSPGQEGGPTELALCLEHLRTQGERLSKLAAELVEREIELSQANMLAEKRLQQLEQIKVLAGNRIRQLDQEIRRLRQEL